MASYAYYCGQLVLVHVLFVSHILFCQGRGFDAVQVWHAEICQDQAVSHPKLMSLSDGPYVFFSIYAEVNPILLDSGLDQHLLGGVKTELLVVNHQNPISIGGFLVLIAENSIWICGCLHDLVGDRTNNLRLVVRIHSLDLSRAQVL